MRYERAAAWLVAGALTALPWAQAPPAAEGAAAQSTATAGNAAAASEAKPASAQGAAAGANTSGTAMDAAAWEAALAAGATVSAVHGTVAPEASAGAPAVNAPAAGTPAAGTAVQAGAGEASAPTAAAVPEANAVQTTAAAEAQAVQQNAAADVTAMQAQQQNTAAQMPEIQAAQQTQAQPSQTAQLPPQAAADAGQTVQLPTRPDMYAESAALAPNTAARVRELMQKFKLMGDARSGAYSWIYTSPTWTAEAISRPAAGSSYFLLAGRESLRFQSLDCDEVWYFHEGCGMKLTVLLADGATRTFELGVGGAAMPMILIPKGQIFAAENVVPTGYSFISCMTIPALETTGIRVWQREELLARYPQAREVIERYTDAPRAGSMQTGTAGEVQASAAASVPKPSTAAQTGGDVHG